MNYEITITKREPNPNYKPLNPYGGSFQPSEPQYLNESALSTVLSEEEFKKLRDEVLKNF